VRTYDIAHYPLVPLHIDGEHRQPETELEDLRLSAALWDMQYDAACCVMCRVLRTHGLQPGSPDLGDPGIEAELTGHFFIELFEGEVASICPNAERNERICLRKYKSKIPARAVVPPLTLQIPIK
jgi:hypothetical protein